MSEWSFESRNFEKKSLKTSNEFEFKYTYHKIMK